MENELEMIQTLFGYQSFGLIPFPCAPFKEDIHNSSEGRLLYHKALQGIQMKDEEIYKWFGEKKLDNCGLILGSKGNLSVIEFENDQIIQDFLKTVENFEDSVSNIIFKNLMHNLYESTTTVLTPEKKIQFWFEYSSKLPSYKPSKDQKTNLNKGISIYSDGYIVAPPSFVRNNNFVDQFELVNGKKPILFPQEIDFFENILSV
ncbi:MAG: bifunctional DNA primase/polymerase [Dehalococcoidia bacterium]|nr:MAG: hypothetical protein EVA32_03720 [Chloroflexota bacterium]|tara:strand:+ start:1160 stop:1771 length:612 start_codon:yes stop_codon:yes gene_type:complete